MTPALSITASLLYAVAVSAPAEGAAPVDKRPGGPAIPSPAQSPKPARTPPRSARGAQTPKVPAALLLQATDDIARQVAALRQLPLKRPISRGVLTRAEVGQKLKERIAKEYTPEEVRGEAQVLKRLGLLGPDVDYEKLILDVLMEQVAGFYDPYAGKLYIADWLPLELQRVALAHEIQHALQDQHFDLKRFSAPIKDDGDRQLARSALVEGDGTVVMLEFQARAMGLSQEMVSEAVRVGSQMLQGSFGDSPLLDKAPAFLRQTLVFPYLAGLSFAAAQRTQASSSTWSKLDQAFRTPPDSTEQVIHPEKYAAREEPIPIVPAALTTLGARKELRRDVLGELEWKILLSDHVGDEAASSAAAGWGGDRLVAFADPSRPSVLPTVVLLSAWDSVKDAEEAERAMRAMVSKLSGTPSREGPIVDRASEGWIVERHGPQVLALLGAPAGADVPAVAAEIWKTWKVGAPVKPAR